MARALKRFGLSLSEAHEALNQLKAERSTAISLLVSEQSGPLSALERFGVVIVRKQA